ncbi:MAG TPA: hypothetical protein ENN87_12275, partial [Phycisphaerales bacterium]|nr:hypothetical protein [Phycisphaerales bacterium]
MGRSTRGPVRAVTRPGWGRRRSSWPGRCRRSPPASGRPGADAASLPPCRRPRSARSPLRCTPPSPRGSSTAPGPIPGPRDMRAS